MGVAGGFGILGEFGVLDGTETLARGPNTILDGVGGFGNDKVAFSLSNLINLVLISPLVPPTASLLALQNAFNSHPFHVE